MSATAPYSNPYWLNEKHDIGIYTVHNPSLIGKPENDAFAKVVFDITVEDLNLKVERAVVYKATDPVKGEVYRPFEILPPATVNISDKVFVFTDANAKTIQLTVKANTADVSGTLQLKGSEGWNISIKNPEFKLANKGDEIIIEASVTATKGAKDGQLNASVLINNVAYTKSIKRIEYDHIPYQFILSDAEAGLVNIDLKRSGVNIGYIPGAGDDVPACLKQIGYNVTMLTDDLLTNENLVKYNAIVTGVRAFNTFIEYKYRVASSEIMQGGDAGVFGD